MDTATFSSGATDVQFGQRVLIHAAAGGAVIWPCSGDNSTARCTITHRNSEELDMNPTATQSTTRETVDAFFTRFGAGDLPALLDLFAEQVDFNVAGAPNVPWAGRRSNKQEIAEFFGLFGKYLTSAEEFALSTTVIDGEHAIATGRCVFGVLSTGKKFTNEFALHFTVTAGKIVRYHMYENSHAISAAFTA